MKLTIVLKKEDAAGLGGQILEEMGMHRSAYEPEVFSVQHLQDPRLVAPPDVSDSMWAIPYVEALMDAGIRPMRVFQKNDSTIGLTPLFASVADSLEAAADALEKLDCNCGADNKAIMKDAEGNCQGCGKPVGSKPNPIQEAIKSAPLNAGKSDVGLSQKSDDLTDAAVGMKDHAKAAVAHQQAQKAHGEAARAAERGTAQHQHHVDQASFHKRQVAYHDKMSASVSASKGVIDMKTWKMIREKANDALEKAGFDGNGRFKTIGQANSKLADVLSNFGLQLGDVMSADRFREPSRTQNFSIEFVNPMDSFSPVAFDDSMVHYSYYKLSDDRVEVVAYLS